MSMDGLKHLQVERPEPGLMVVRFNRPEVHNALNTATSEDILKVFGKLAFTPGDLRCVILTAAGEKAFSAGGDLKERQGMTDDAWRAQHAIIEEAAYSIINCSVPVIAAVNGVAFGGGCELALCCDFIYAARHARFALPEVTRGIMPGAGATQNLPRAVGVRRAKQIIMSGLPFTAEQAYEWGMVNESLRCSRTDAAGALARAHDLRQRADLGAADQEGDQRLDADRSHHGPCLRDAML